ncbi:MAG: DUF523 domain-containing protein [Oscillibacter sp.]
MKLLVSACLLGRPCRYDGASKADPAVLRLSEKYDCIPVCPEQMGGLPTPRAPAERQGDRVVTAAGGDVTRQYRSGGEAALERYEKERCQAALLKERSPSCGCGAIYDGTFTRTLCPRDGVTAELLKARGIPVYGESQISALLEMMGEA